MHIVFFDIDGTLATGRDVPESAAAAVARLRANGDLVFICTGRPKAYAQGAFGTYADGFVCNNGRLAVRGDEVLIDAALTAEQIDRITTTLDAHGVGYAFFGNGYACYGGNPAYREMAEAVQGGMRMADGVDVSGPSLYNFDFYFADTAERDRVAADLGELCLVNPHGPHPSADVTVVGADKGDAVRGVAAALGVALEDTYAFGDGINDLSMIKAAGHGVAMGNAVDEVKDAAEFVTTDINEDGVANGLAHYGLA